MSRHKLLRQSPAAAALDADLGRLIPRHPWPDPDAGVLHLDRRPPPKLPIELFGPKWREWITTTAAAAACPPDYVVVPLLASASVLIGHARGAQATPGGGEPPHLWLGPVGPTPHRPTPAPDSPTPAALPPPHRALTPP